MYNSKSETKKKKDEFVYVYTYIYINNICVMLISFSKQYFILM